MSKTERLETIENAPQVETGNNAQYCKNFSAVLLATDEIGNRLVTRTRCKQWTCTYCANINRRQWNARIIDHINKTGGKWTWWTLTAHSKARGAYHSLKNLRRAHDRIMKRMKRRFGKFDYVRVYEPHADGSYHMHAIGSFHFGDIRLRESVDGEQTKYSKWLDETAEDLKIGWYTHADDIDASKHGGYIASYVTKYIVKFSPEQKDEIGRVRHIQTSQGWAKLESEKKYKWVMKSGIYADDLAQAIEEKKDVIDIQTGEKITSDNFATTYIYPPEFDHVGKKN